MTPARENAAPPVSPMRGWGLTCAVFVSVALFCVAVTAAIAWKWGGERYLPSAFTAWGLVWGAALIALIMIFLGRQMGQGVGAVLLGMMVRMGLPLMFAIMLTNESPYWNETRLMAFLLGNYFVALIAETGLAVHLLGNSPPAFAKPAAAKEVPSKA